MTFITITFRIILSIGVALLAGFFAMFTLQLVTGPSKGFDYHDAATAGPAFFAIIAFAAAIFRFRWWEALAPLPIPVILVCVLPYYWVKIGIAIAFVCPIVIAAILAFFLSKKKSLTNPSTKHPE
jgi:hypothetical protein